MQAMRLSGLAALLMLSMGGLASGQKNAIAANLGGDCCGDLEEHVTELEGTTVRKGNRLNSVTLSGRVDETLLNDKPGVARVDHATPARKSGSSSSHDSNKGLPTGDTAANGADPLQWWIDLFN